jgi:hypothetical protein
MNLLSKWRWFVALALVIWAILLVHPFIREGTIISHVEYPASVTLRAGDYIISVDDNKISSPDNFNSIISGIAPDNIVKLSIERESFPYMYIKAKEPILAQNRSDQPFVGVTVAESKFSRLKLGYELAGGNKFVVSTNDPLAAKKMSERFAMIKVFDYKIETTDGQLNIYTTSGNEIIPLLTKPGKFEAKVGDSTFFTTSDVKSFCISGVNCLLHMYPYVNKSENTSNYVWKYGFEARLTPEAASRFADLTKGLGISSCEMDRCLLNQSINYYVDGEIVGSEDIYSDSKGRNYSSPMIGGFGETKEDAQNYLYRLQAFLKSGEIDVQLQSVEKSEPNFGQNLLLIVLVAAFGILIASSVMIFVQSKSGVIALSGLVVGVSELMFVLGALAGLNIVIKPISLVALVFVACFTLFYQNYTIRWIGKESFILKKLAELGTKINWWVIGAITVGVVISFVSSEMGAILLIYFVTVLLLTKAMFYGSIISRKH